LFKATPTEHKLKGLFLYGEDLPLTHQTFVDDTMRLGTPTVQEAQEFNQILDLSSLSQVWKLTELDLKHLSLTLLWLYKGK